MIGNILEDNPLKFEQQIIREGLTELLMITNVESSENMNCTERNITILVVIASIPSNVLSDKESDPLSDGTGISDLSEITNTDVVSWKNIWL